MTSFLREPMALGVVASILVHGTLVSVGFVPTAPKQFAPMDSRLEVILLNSKSAAKPVKPDVVAQVNMEAGGDRIKGRATSPLPAESKVENGKNVVRKRMKVAQLEALQRQLMAMAGSPSTFVDRQRRKRSTGETGADSENVQLVMARLQAQIAKNISDYNKRPRRLTYGVNAVGATYAQYVSNWAARIEDIGTDRYPKEARGKYYDALIITVEIHKDGHVGDIIINRKSKYEALNRAIKEIVLAGAPYQRFTPEMAAEGDILQIVRTWTFTNRSLQTSAPAKAGG